MQDIPELCANGANLFTRLACSKSDTLVSSNGRFRFGFFSPLNSTNRYVGIWYNTEGFDTKVVWVANRNNPINGSSGVLKISVDGNLQLSDGKKLIYWSSNISHQANSTAIAQLQDTGNLVLLSSAIGKVVWQSFEHLTNSMLPHTTVSIDLSIVRNLDENVYPVLRSWKSASDPSTGRFTLSMVPFQITEFIIIYDDEIYWRSGPWNGSQFLGLPNVSAETAVSFRTVYDNRNRTLDLFYSEVDETVLRYYALNDDGNLVLNNWDEDSQKWELLWRSIDSLILIVILMGSVVLLVVAIQKVHQFAVVCSGLSQKILMNGWKAIGLVGVSEGLHCYVALQGAKKINF